MSISTTTSIYYYPGELFQESTSFSVRGHVYDPALVGINTSALVNIMVRNASGAMVLQVTDTIYQGYFSYAFTAGLPAGSYTGQVTFLGDAVYTPSISNVRGFTVTPMGTIYATHLSCYWDGAPINMVPFAIHGHLYDDSSVGVLNKTVTVTVRNLSGVIVVQGPASITNDTGWYSVTVTLPAGGYTVTADFAGDANYSTSTLSVSLNVSPTPRNVSYTSSPISVVCTVNGMPLQSGQSTTAGEGTVIQVVAPSEVRL